MRILHVITSLQTGGAERLMVDLLPLLRNGEKNQVELLLFDGSNVPFLDELRTRRVKVHHLTTSSNVYSPLNIFRMVRYIGRYDIIHTHNTACQLFVPMAKLLSFTTKRLVTTEHNATNRRRSKWWLKPVDRWMYNRYAAIVCVADQTRENLEAYIGKRENMYTILNGVDVDRFIQPVKEIAGKQEFVITMVSAFRAQKDHATLLKAMKRLPENYRLQLVGGGEYQSQIQGLCRDMGLNGRVDFMGVRSDVPEILAASDVVVLSSHWEGLSLSSIEGMASGRPFVASDVDGLREMVGGAGVLFPHKDDAALAEKIQWLCEHPDEYRQVAQRCQDKARQYDISVTARKYMDVYNLLIK